MPTVPTISIPSVAPSESASVPYQTDSAATPEAFGASIGRAQQGLGSQIDKTGDILANHALKMQEDVNASSAKDLFLNADVEVGNITTEYNSLEGANRVNAYPKFVEDVKSVREKYKAAAPNDDVSRRFDQDFSRRVGYSIVDGARSAAVANKQYQHSTNDAVRQNSLQHIADNTQDDQRFQTNLEIGLDANKNSDIYRGSSPEVQQQQDQAFISSAWATRLQSMSKNDPLRARELLKSNSGAIDGETKLKLNDTINQGIINVQSRVESDRIIQSGALVSPELAERVKKLEGYSEKPYADFKQTSSGYGTKAQPGDENIPPDQRKAVYEQRLYSELGRAANIVDQFAPGLPKGTRDAMISLTYNAGSAWTSSGLGTAIKSGNLDSAQYRFGMYTNAGGTINQGLVDRRATELSWWGGEAHDTDMTSQLGKALDAAKETALKTFPDDPANQAKYLDTLQNRVKSDFSVMQGQARDQQLQIRNTVQKELFAPDSTVINYDGLSPQARQMYDMAPPMLQKSFDAAMVKNATRDVPLTNERQSRYDSLRGEGINEPEKFMSRDISSEDLPRAQKSSLLKMQQDRKALLDKGVKVGAAMQIMQPLLNDAGIGKSAVDLSRNSEYNKFSGVFEKALSSLEDEKKRPPNEKEIKEIGNGLLKDVVTSPGYFFGDNSDRAYRVIADKTPITLRTNDTAEHYAELPRGATFIGPDNKTRVKP